MDRKQIVGYWATEAEDALRVAKHLFEKKDYSCSLFFGHLAVEKIIKAIFVQNTSRDVPRSHNLPRLASGAGIVLTDRQKRDLVRITVFNLEARYPDYKREFRKKCTTEFTEVEINKINEVFVWLKSMLL